MRRLVMFVIAVTIGFTVCAAVAGGMNKFCWECWEDFDDCLDSAISHWETCTAGCGQNQSCLDQCEADYDQEVDQCNYVLDMCFIDCVD